MIIVGVDPGTTDSSAVIFNGTEAASKVEYPNAGLLDWLEDTDQFTGGQAVLAIEWIESFGMAVGREVFETCYWVGRFAQAWRGPVVRVTRRQVKLHLCQSMRAKDANIRQALLDRFGGKAAVGTKAKPGPLYGISAHKWSALAVAVTYYDTREEYVAPRPVATLDETTEF